MRGVLVVGVVRAPGLTELQYGKYHRDSKSYRRRRLPHLQMLEGVKLRTAQATLWLVAVAEADVVAQHLAVVVRPWEQQDKQLRRQHRQPCLALMVLGYLLTQMVL